MCTTIDAHSTTDFLRLLLHRRHLLLHLPTQQFFIHHLERLLTHIICRQWRCFLTLPHPTTFLANLLTSTLIGHLLQLLPTLPQSPTATTTPPPMSSWTTTPMPIPMPTQHAPTRLQLSPQRLFQVSPPQLLLQLRSICLNSHQIWVLLNLINLLHRAYHLHIRPFLRTVLPP